MSFLPILTPRKNYQRRQGLMQTPKKQRLHGCLHQQREHRFIPWDNLLFAIDDFPYGKGRRVLTNNFCMVNMR